MNYTIIDNAILCKDNDKYFLCAVPDSSCPNIADIIDTYESTIDDIWTKLIESRIGEAPQDFITNYCRNELHLQGYDLDEIKKVFNSYFVFEEGTKSLLISHKVHLVNDEDGHLLVKNDSGNDIVEFNIKKNSFLSLKEVIANIPKLHLNHKRGLYLIIMLVLFCCLWGVFNNYHKLKYFIINHSAVLANNDTIIPHQPIMPLEIPVEDQLIQKGWLVLKTDTNVAVKYYISRNENFELSKINWGKQPKLNKVDTIRPKQNCDIILYGYSRTNKTNKCIKKISFDFYKFVEYSLKSNLQNEDVIKQMFPKNRKSLILTVRWARESYDEEDGWGEYFKEFHDHLKEGYHIDSIAFYQNDTNVLSSQYPIVKYIRANK